MTTTISRHKRTGWRFAGYLTRRAIMMEIRGYQSIYRFLFRRPKVPAGHVEFSYYRPALAILIVFIAVSAVEVVVVDLIVRRWASIRIPLDCGRRRKRNAAPAHAERDQLRGTAHRADRSTTPARSRDNQQGHAVRRRLSYLHERGAARETWIT
jgi:hypothetical protein